MYMHCTNIIYIFLFNMVIPLLLLLPPLKLDDKPLRTTKHRQEIPAILGAKPNGTVPTDGASIFTIKNGASRIFLAGNPRFDQFWEWFRSSWKG